MELASETDVRKIRPAQVLGRALVHANEAIHARDQLAGETFPGAFRTSGALELPRWTRPQARWEIDPLA